MVTEVAVIIPALNEENSIGKVIREIPALAGEVIVVDNGSSDKTSDVAKAAGATVLFEGSPGYGNACLKGMEFLRSKSKPPTIVVFIDGDYSDFPEEMESVIKPIVEDKLDLVIGSRALGVREKGSMTLPQIFGNWIATRLMLFLYNVKFTDLGPFRAINYDSLMNLGMKDRNFGWTVEMQLKAAKFGLRCGEVPVNYRRRIGFSKVSGTIRGTFMAGYKILWTIFKYL